MDKKYYYRFSLQMVAETILRVAQERRRPSLSVSIVEDREICARARGYASTELIKKKKKKGGGAREKKVG